MYRSSTWHSLYHSNVFKKNFTDTLPVSLTACTAHSLLLCTNEIWCMVFFRFWKIFLIVLNYHNFPFVPDLDTINKKKSDFTREITDQSGKPLFGLKALQRASRNESQDEVDGKTSHLIFNGKQSPVTSGNVTFIIKLHVFFSQHFVNCILK